MKQNLISEFPLKCYVAAISVGVVESEIITDLCYEQDSNAEVDMNIVMTNENKFIEVQGTGEKGTFDIKQLNALVKNASKAIKRLHVLQKKSLGTEAVYLYEEIDSGK